MNRETLEDAIADYTTREHMTAREICDLIEAAADAAVDVDADDKLATLSDAQLEAILEAIRGFEEDRARA